MRQNIKTFLWFMIVIGIITFIFLFVYAGNRFLSHQFPVAFVLMALGLILVSLVGSTVFILGEQAGKEFADPAYKDRSWR